MKGNIIFWNGANKLGNTVGYVRYGTQCFRAYVKNVSNPRSAAQVLQRAKMALMVTLFQNFRYGARKGFKYAARIKGRTPFNEFVHENISLITGSTPEALTIDNSRIQISKGPVPLCAFSQTIDVASVPNCVSVTVSESGSTLPGASANDSIYVYVFCPDGEGGILSPAHVRNTGKIEVPVPAAWSGLDVHVYGFVVGGAGEFEGQGSYTDYLGHATLN